jgi:dihydroorotate dehydrogenase (NAD+) catalytic subunit
VFLASGPAGYGTEYEELIDLRRIGAVVTKTVTFRPRAGNPGRRLWETSAGLLNSIGLENVGAERFFAEKLPRLVEAGARAVVSLGAEGWDEYRPLLDAAAAAHIVDAVELNLSCPNVDCGGMSIGGDPALVERYVRAAREALPEAAIVAKLTPNTADITILARAAAEGGAHAVTAINTVLGMDLRGPGLEPVFRRERAGLSGPAIFPVALDAVWRIARAVDIPVVASGGISSVEDAEKFFAAGAAAVEVGTAIFYDPGLPERIVDALEARGAAGPPGAKPRKRRKR